MRYFISKRDIAYYPSLSVEACKKMLGNFLAVDVETTGLYSAIHQLLTVQIKSGNDSFIIDCTTIDIKEFKWHLENIPCVYHNAKFDLQFMFSNDIWPVTNVHCTFIREKILTAGLNSNASLLYCAKKYAKVTLDKSVQKKIKLDIIYTEKFLEYAFLDVEYLEYIFNVQEYILNKEDLQRTYSLERFFIPVLAYVEYSGFKLNQTKFAEKVKINEIEAEAAFIKLQDRALAENICPPNLFGECMINWRSPAQVIEAMKLLGVDIKVKKKGKKGMKSTVEKKYLEKYTHIPLVKDYLTFKSKIDTISKYGYNYLNHVSLFPDSRIRTSFSQIVKTGRMSGAEESDNFKEKEKVNLQNIPRISIPKNISDEERQRYIAKSERLCFEPNEGNVFIVADFTQQEQVIMANQSQDEKLIEFFLGSGSNDMHCYVAKGIYNEIQDLSDEQIKELHPEKRQIAKSAGFCLNYNGSGETLAVNSGLPKEVGEEIYRKYFETFSGLKKEFDRRKNFWQAFGYIVTNNVTKRRIYFDAKNIKEGLKGVNWDNYRLGKAKYAQFEEYYESILDLLRKKSSLDNASVNYPTQSTGADITKAAGIRLFHYIIKNNLQNIVLIPLILHDEIVTECPKVIVEDTRQAVYDSMIKAGKKFCTIVPLGATVHVGEEWNH